MVMRNYEIIMVASANQTDEEGQVVFDKFKKIITDAECTVQFESSWGRRRLAYEVEKERNGIYHLLYVEGHGELLEELKRQVGYDEKMLKFFVVSVDDLETAYQNFEALKADPQKTANLVSEVIGA